jgi:hypothetical protein
MDERGCLSMSAESTFCIENNHRSKDAGLVGYPCSSGISSSSPTFANNEATVVLQLSRMAA